MGRKEEELIKLRCIKAIEKTLLPREDEDGFVKKLQVPKLAEKLGISPAVLSYLRNNKRKGLSVAMLIKIAKVTDTPMSDLMRGFYNE